MSQTVEQKSESGLGTQTGRWMTMIHNNSHNSFEEVVAILMVATDCGQQEAAIEVWEAHTFGKAPVHFASEKECRRAASIIENIGVRTDVRPEWED